MKQRVEVCITTPSTSWELKILSVHEVDGKLIVVSKAKRPGWAGDAISSASDARIVSTSAEKELPVVNYLTDVSKEEIADGRHIGNYGHDSGMAQYSSGTPSVFTAITNVSEITDVLAKGKCLYRPRTDGLKAVRLSHFERGETQPQMIDNAEAAVLTTEQMQGVVNIYPVVDDGVFKVVVESICQEQETKSIEHIFHAIQSAIRESNANIDLDGQFFMTDDDALHFTAMADGKPAQFTTNAVEFSLPANNVGAITEFIKFLDHVAKAAKKKSGEYNLPHTHVQVSQKSVLSSFDELLICNKKNKFGDDKTTLIYPETINIADFYQQPGIVHNPISTFKPLIGALINANLPAYAGMQSALKTLHPMEHGVIYFPHIVLGTILGENIELSKLRGDENINERVELADKLAAKLSTQDMLDKAGSMLRTFVNNGISEFVMKTIDVTACDGGKYNPNYTEFQFLFFADYCIREDGRMSIKPESSAGYTKHYAKGKKNYGIFETEMRFLAKIVGLEFASDTDFHKEIIFTPASTLKLKALGLHLNQANLRLHLKNTSEAAVDVTPAVIVAAKPEPTTEDILNSKTALALRAQYPQSNEILQAMQQAGLLADAAANVRVMFANVIRACASYQEPQEEGDEAKERESIAALVNLYKLLEGKNGAASLLTLKIHNQIINSIVRANRCTKVAELAGLVGELDAKKAEKLFLGAHEFLNIGEMVKAFDDTNESLLYLFNALDDHRAMGGMMGFWDTLACQQMDDGLGWLRKEDFKLTVDNIKTGKYHHILSTLGYLRQAGALESHRERYLQDIHQSWPLHELLMASMLTRENIDLAMVNPDFGIADRLCENYGFMGWRAKNYSAEADKQFRQTLLAYPEVTRAIKTMNTIHRQYEKSGNQVSQEQCRDDLEKILKSSHVVKLPEPEKSNELVEAIKKGIALFKPAEPKDLTECMAMLRKKYSYQEPEIEMQQLAVAKM